MAYRRKTSSARRKPAVRRRRRSMGRVTTAGVTAAAMSAGKAALGGAAAAILTNVVGDNLGGFKPYTGLLGAVATSLFLKQPEIAAGMAGYSGAKVALSLVGGDTTKGIGKLLAENAYGVDPSMYLNGYETPGMGASDIYASAYTLNGYEVPGL